MQFFPAGLSPQGVVHVTRFFTDEVDNFEFFLAFGHDSFSGGAVADAVRGAIREMSAAGRSPKAVQVTYNETFDGFRLGGRSQHPRESAAHREVFVRIDQAVRGCAGQQRGEDSRAPKKKRINPTPADMGSLLARTRANNAS